MVIIRTFTPAPHQKSTEPLAFRAAVLFAQEYGILAASAEDRPFVPGTKIVLCARNASVNGDDGVKGEGRVPEGMRWAFRKWDDAKVGEVRVLELREVMEAMEGRG